jgi:CheY-like chemotaxis protein
VRFEVHDSGPGIEEAVQQRLFEPFTQADESTTRRFGGTGLGLSICRELAHMMKGEVGVISRPGAGSCFWAELPLPQLPPLSSAPAVAAAARPAAPAALRSARVLLAEDNPVNMMIGVAMLERWGLQVEQAHDGRQAVQLVRDAVRAGQPFDAVLMDLQMPVMSGYEATLELRKQFSAEVLPIVALTAAALVTEREQALGAGMSDFLTKPIDAEKLRAALARVLGDAVDRPPSGR